MSENKERIAKFIASSGFCSRREAEKLILEKRVTVNNTVLETPAFLVSKNDQIIIDGKKLCSQSETRLWAYYKPTRVITSHKDPQGRKTVFEILPKTLPRVISVGRLDFNSEGLLLLTNSGELAHKLEHPSAKIYRIYHVRVFGKIQKHMIEKLQKGISIDGINYAPCRIKILNQSFNNTWLEFMLTEGKNREIRNMLAFWNLKISRLIRVKYGNISLDNLSSGQLKEISKEEVKKLCAL